MLKLETALTKIKTYRIKVFILTDCRNTRHGQQQLDHPQLAITSLQHFSLLLTYFHLSITHGIFYSQVSTINTYYSIAFLSCDLQENNRSKQPYRKVKWALKCSSGRILNDQVRGYITH